MLKLDKVNELLALAMENLLNNNNPAVSKNETISVEDALAVAKLGKVCVETYKVKMQAVKMLDNPEDQSKTEALLVDAGIIDVKSDKKEQGVQ